jgi:hypothetical protein
MLMICRFIYLGIENDDLASISRWAAEYGLSLKPRKSQTIPIFNSNAGLVMPHLFLGTETIPWCDVVTDLGVVIDGRRTFGRQVTKVCSKIYSTLYRLRLLKFLTPKRVRLKLCKALLLPCFFYFDVVFSRLYSVDSRRYMHCSTCKVCFW